jgi:hypothetical protein
MHEHDEAHAQERPPEFQDGIVQNASGSMSGMHGNDAAPAADDAHEERPRRGA